MRIFVISGYGYWGDFLPTDLNSDDRQVGGGETAMISISRELAALGHEVVVFYDTKPGKYDGVDYLPTGLYAMMACNMEHDVLVSWDNPHALRVASKSGIRVMAYQLNDTFVGTFTHIIDMYMHPSQWHADRYKELYPEIDELKQVARATNAVDFTRYTEAVEVDPYRVIYSSSPDRGLHHLLDIWPEVVKQEKRANLEVYYDMDTWMDNVTMLAEAGYRTVTTERAMILKEQMSNGKLKNVTFHGGVGQGKLAKAQLAARVLAYPCDPVQPTEGFSMTVLEGIASGCDVITTDADAFPELWASSPGVTMLPLPIDQTTWVETILKPLGTDKEGPRVNTTMTWKAVARKWETNLRSCLKMNQ